MDINNFVDTVTLSSGNTATGTGVFAVGLKGGILTQSQSGAVWTYVRPDGAVATFANPTNPATVLPLLSTLVFPSGEIYGYNWTVHLKSSVVDYFRLNSVSTNRGYQLKYRYGSTFPSNPISVHAINNAIDYCAVDATPCSGLTEAWPTLNETWTQNATVVTHTMTDLLGHQTSVVTSGSSTTTLTKPSGQTVTYLSDASGITSVSNGVGTWSYTRDAGCSNVCVRVVDPMSHIRQLGNNLGGIQTPSIA